MLHFNDFFFTFFSLFLLSQFFAKNVHFYIQLQQLDGGKGDASAFNSCRQFLQESNWKRERICQDNGNVGNAVTV